MIKIGDNSFAQRLYEREAQEELLISTYDNLFYKGDRQVVLDVARLLAERTAIDDRLEEVMEIIAEKNPELLKFIEDKT